MSDDRTSQPAAAGDAGLDAQSAQDLTLYVQNLLTQMQSRFQGMSDTIINRIDSMGSRIDQLEKSIADLMQQAGVDESAAAAALQQQSQQGQQQQGGQQH